jgi:hypothetical protein
VKPPLALAISSAKNLKPVELANLRLDLSVSSSKVLSLFMPVYIFEFPRFGANFRVFVCGSTGQVGGETHFSPLKAYVALLPLFFCNILRRYIVSGAVVTATLASLPLNLL